MNKNESVINNDANDRGKAGGILIVDYIEKEKVILLGRSNIPKRENTYESFGGKYELTDLSSLHTAVREFIEEFFNIKISLNELNILIDKIVSSNIILKQACFYGVSYLLDFKGLNFIFQYLCLLNNGLQKYNIKNVFNLGRYIKERIITAKPYDGLNEISAIECFRISDIKHNRVNLRWFTKKIIDKMVF
jgi:hypothetical protein